ncbi:MAG: DUF1015 domain-containing protein [Phycisphaerales bacterium]|nr:MAG: DUF1015 domain-containing protein [Phycisphaerales bacterium]
MAQIEPFAAIRYDFAGLGGDVSSRVAPPYDVLDQGEKDALLAKSDRNVVAIDLPHIPPKSAGPAECYDRAARTLADWLADGTFVREDSPALYVYHQVFTVDGKAYTRRKFIARLRLTPFSQGVVLPHEQTFGGPKEDRLALTKATRCNLSPVFALHTDPGDEIGSAFAAAVAKPPDVTATLEEVENRVWIVKDGAVIDRVRSAMAAKRVFIADGHHRYGTALLYRDYLARQFGGSLPDEHSANYVMMVLASMDDPGCLILPYPRVLVNVGLDAILAAWRPGTAPAPPAEADLVLFEGASGRSAGVRFTNRSALAAVAPDRSDAWRALDSAYIHGYLIDELTAKSDIGPPTIRYVKSTAHAKAGARDENGVALLVKATPMEQLRAVSEAGDLMPQKSTYFYPKLATGLTINPLE